MVIPVLFVLMAAAATPCTASNDCAVGQCTGQVCSLITGKELFPAVALSEIPLGEPHNLAGLNSSPSLHWQYPPGADLVAAAIVREPPTYATGQPDRIANLSPGTVAWIWHSNLPGEAGANFADFNQGRLLLASANSADDSALLSADAPPPLGPGTYYWGVWGWTAGQLTHRSQVRAFFVGKESTTGSACDQRCDDGSLALRCDAVCVIGCASDADCFQGETCDLGPASDPKVGFGVCHTTSPGCACASDQMCLSDIQLCVPRVQIRSGSAGCNTSGASKSDEGVVAGMVSAFVLATIRSRRRQHHRAHSSGGRE
jgi:hypothetical protein